MKHAWEPTDNQGHSMQCTECGTAIYVEDKSWDRELDAECHGKPGQVYITDGSGNTRKASPSESARFKAFCNRQDSIDEKLRRTAKVPGWTWEHTGGNIYLAYLPVTLRETPDHTGEREVELSLGSEGVEFKPFRVKEFDENPHRKATLPDGTTEEIGELYITEYGVLGTWDERFWGVDVYEDGWRERVLAWCREKIESPDPDAVAKDIVSITELDML